jgi:hypothetical protein
VTEEFLNVAEVSLSRRWVANVAAGYAAKCYGCQHWAMYLSIMRPTERVVMRPPRRWENGLFVAQRAGIHLKNRA